MGGRAAGWFPLKDHFVAVAGHHTYGVNKNKHYAGFIGEVVRYRDALDLDPPKFLEGDDPNAVVSNCTYP